MTLKYRAEVDGLRAIAIIPVVLYHAGIPSFSGGFVGVDVFFVISGYLITSIILFEKREGRFSLLEFYSRRIRRIFPALFAMMAVSYPIAWALLGPSAMKEFSGSAAASTAFVANAYFLRVSDYFATAAELKPLLHNWSLSIEEQFYFFFPAVVLLSWRLGARWQAGLFAAAALASLGLAQWQVDNGDAARAFFLLQTRFWELLIGVLAAYWLASRRGQEALYGGQFRHASLLGIALILFATFTYDENTPFPGLNALVPCLGAFMVIAFTAPRSLAGVLLGWRPMVFIGLVSYSLYLWHFPLLAFARVATGTDNEWLLLGICLLAFLVACLSWRYIECPIREMRAMPALKLYRSAAFGMALLVGLGLTGWETKGYGSSYVKYRLDAATRANYEKYQPQTGKSTVVDEACWFEAVKPDAAFEARFKDCAGLYGKAVLVLGDSHAGNIYRALRADSGMPFIVALWRGGCRPFRPKPECPYDAVAPFLLRHGASISQVVFHVSGSHYILDHSGKGDSNAAFVPGNQSRIATEAIEKTAGYLASLPGGQDIVWLGPFAEARIDLEDPENYSPDRLRFNPVSLELFHRLDQAMKAAAKDASNFRYLSLVDALKFDVDTLLRGDCMTFSDVDHFSRCGEKYFGEEIAAVLR